MGNFGPAEMLLIAVFALLIFGPQKLPEIARSVGRAIREFKKATGELTAELKTLDQPAASRSPAQAPDAPERERRPGPR